ncbi:MAG TPA: DUF2254 domain-containing protein [Solirubrobacterales bacterium]|nr:DUF2254 domain-containing protein [Solirubrobacterales bacterium]
MISWRRRWQVREYLQNSIWIIPGAFALAAFLLGREPPRADIEAEFTRYGAEAARGLLSALASGMIAFTGFVFSVLLLAVTFGSNQFSPRMLRRFLRDTTTKVALGTFIATFLYALLELRWVGSPENPDLVPNSAITISLLLLLASMFMFLRLIHRATSRLRVAAVVRGIGRDALKVIEKVYPDPLAEPGAELGPPSGEPAVVRYRGAPAILQSMDFNGLLSAAERAGAVIELAPAIGDPMVEGVPLFRVYGGEIEERKLQSSVAVGDERTLPQDPAFAFRLLADTAAKALSPGVNDPSTAVQALDQLEALLIELSGRQLTPGVSRDSGGAIRLRWPVPSWEDYLSLALDEARQFGEGSIQVSRRLRALLERLHEIVPEPRRAAVEAKLELVRAGADRAFADEPDRASAAAGDPQGIGSSREPALVD